VYIRLKLVVVWDIEEGCNLWALSCVLIIWFHLFNNNHCGTGYFILFFIYLLPTVLLRYTKILHIINKYNLENLYLCM
jgi:hypothetical protein